MTTQVDIVKFPLMDILHPKTPVRLDKKPVLHGSAKEQAEYNDWKTICRYKRAANDQGLNLSNNQLFENMISDGACHFGKSRLYEIYEHFIAVEKKAKQ